MGRPDQLWRDVGSEAPALAATFALGRSAIVANKGPAVASTHRSTFSAGFGRRASPSSSNCFAPVPAGAGLPAGLCHLPPSVNGYSN
jgi:hypothetical protein